jgi:S-DNA-T family DNA segregation ATPase FtsK/SpoIIIE
MAKPKPTGQAVQPPFIQAFPRLSLGIRLTAAVMRLIAAGVRRLWPWRRELAVVMVLNIVWRLVDMIPSSWAALAVYLGLLGGVAVWPRSRQWLLGWLRCGVTRRWLVAGFRHTRTANLDGHLPRIRSVRPTRVGEHYRLRLHPGHSHELLEVRVEELRAAMRCRDVRLHRDPDHSERVEVDVVRVDTLTHSAPVAWRDDRAEVLSMWDPIHFGVDELGEPVYLNLAEMAVLIGGGRGRGKSSALNVFLAHGSKCPDAELLLIDANRVQLAPWRGRARCFAAADPDDAIAVVVEAQTELDRRLEVLKSLPGVELGVTRHVSHTHNLPMWLLVVDELAYHCSVAGTKAQRGLFYDTLRDVVARGRASGIVVIAATQRPTADLIPTSLRDLFDIRIAYRTMTRTSSDVVLGDDMVKNGFNACDIAEAARGVNWLLAGTQTPTRTKTVWIPPQRRAELAASTLHHGPAPTGLVRAPRSSVVEVA